MGYVPKIKTSYLFIYLNQFIGPCPSGRVRTGLKVPCEALPVTNCKDFLNIYINNSYEKTYAILIT
jgi:hypothetical protein